MRHSHLDRLPRLRFASAALWVALLLGACARSPSPGNARAPLALAVRVSADAAPGETLHIGRPAAARARVWMTRVAPVRWVPPPIPEPAPAAPEPDTLAPAGPASEPGLKPPLLISSDPLRLPDGRARSRVELDVRVDERGVVTDALWTGGSADTSGIAAARRCAYSMRFYPALMGGRPVAVWCRQRFDFSAR